MAKLIYTAICSLDGYVADRDGNFDWSAPNEEVHAFVNELERPIGTYLCGRHLYEVMSFWESYRNDESPETAGSAAMRDYGEIWRAADKIVYSATLERVSSERTRIEPIFDRNEVAERKESSMSDLSIGGPTLAAIALRAGLVDELRMFFVPVIVGGGLAALPPDLRLHLDLLDERRFTGGTVYLSYRIQPGSGREEAE